MPRKPKEVAPGLTRFAAGCLGLFVAGLLLVYGLTGFAVAGATPLTPARAAAVFIAAAALGTALVLGVFILPKRLERTNVSPRWPALLRSTTPGLIIVLGMMAVVAIRGGSFLAAWVQWGWMLPMWIGFGLIGAANLQRTGDSRHCPKCDYEFGDGDEADGPERCPECNAPWRGRLVRGRRQLSKATLGAGVALVACTFALITVGFGLSGAVVRRLPTPAVIAWVRASPQSDRAAWTELSTRTLSAGQTVTLARYVVARKSAARHSMGPEPVQWLESLLNTGTLPKELETRYYAQMFTHRGIAAPARVMAGEPIRVGLRDTWGNDGFTYKCVLYVAGFGVGDGPVTEGRSGEWFYPNLADFGKRDGRFPIPEATLVIPSPGRTKLRAEVWVVVNSGQHPQITWNDDGTPNLPPGAVYTERIIIEQDIEATP